MAANLFTPILNDRTRSIHFFNGRLLTGEDMTAEQRGQHAAHELLANAVGDGVVHGLEVTIAADSSLAAPVVTVTQGLAINRKGETLLLPADTRVQLVRTADAVPPARTLFTACTPPQSGVYVAGAGVYLLTLCSTVAADGSASVSGLGGQPAGCNTRFAVEAVQFRLIELPLTDAEMQDVAHLRNLVAYRCFGVSPSFATDPFGSPDEPPTLLDQLRPRSLTDCDVPLATFYWTATGGLVWGDMWSVRRRVAERTAAVPLAGFIADHSATMDAMLLQFEQQLSPIAAPALKARDVFRYLPPIGVLPVARGRSAGLSQLTFFDQLTTRGPVYVEGSRLHGIVRDALAHHPLDVNSKELIRLYLVRENRQAIDQQRAIAPAAALLFVSGHARYWGDAHYDVAKWNYSNFS
jgi:hypothetical protein